MQAIKPLTRRSLDQLEEEIVSLSERINSSEYEFLVLVREFDLRQGWKAYHFNNCAEWLNFRCGIATATGREKLRVARALFDLPAASAAFQQGKLSYSKARSLSRIAGPHTEEKLVEYALGATAQQVDKHCADLRNVHRELSTPDANKLHQQRYLSRSFHSDGSMTISVELPKESGELVMKALEYAMRDMEANDGAERVTDPGATGDGSKRATIPEVTDGVTDPELAADRSERVQDGKEHWVDYGDELEAAYSGGATRGSAIQESLFQRQADALVQMARGYLAGGKEKSSCTADHYQVMVHVDENALRGEPTEDSKSDLPIETVRRLCCDSALVTVTENEKGDPLHVGRKHRVVQPPLRRALLARDKCCRFPGCTHERWLGAHHVVHWADGGETSLDNTMLLCSRHHMLLHEGGFRIKADCNGEWQFASS